MELIQHIRTRDNTRGTERTVPLAAAFRPPFADFFQVDSLNVVIGVNGDGKTTLLMNLAQCLHERDESRLTGVEYSTNQDATDGNIRWRTGPLPALGVVFYTPLPYRREMLPLADMVDASPQYSSKATKPKIAVFQGVAAGLGIATELRGTISFSPSLITKLLFPVLASDACDTQQPEFKNLAIAMQRARLEMQRYEAVTTDPNGDVDRLLEQVKKDYHEAERSLAPMLIRHFQTHCPQVMLHPLLALASLEKLARTIEDRQQLVRSFLELMELATFSESLAINYTRRFANLLITTIHQTGACVSLTQIPLGAQSHTLVIDERLQKVVMGPDVAIALSWAHLPSGLLALVDQLSRLKVAVTRLVKRGKQHLVLMIDEGDAYLHLDWQRKYIQLLDDFLGEIKRDYKNRKKEVRIQVILASHSLVLAGDVPSVMVTNLSGEISGVRTFAAPLDQLAFRSFKSYSIGAFAVGKINRLHEKILDGTLGADDKALIDQIGDEGVRNALIRAMDEANKVRGDSLDR